MAAKHDVMRIAGAVAHSLGLTALAAGRQGPRGAIFTLHSVVPDSDFLPRENIHTSAKFLDEVLTRYSKRRIAVVSMSEALKRLEAKSSEPFVCFTFDDGYRDNLTVALPIFKKHNAPMTIYMSTAHLERRTEYWWGALRHLVRDASEISGDGLPATLRTSTPAEKIQAYNMLRNLIDSGAISEAQRNALFARYNIPVEQALDRDVMTEAELKAAAESEPLLEIGGHSHTHRKLGTLEEADAFDDIVRNKSYLEGLLGREMIHFAYPYGTAEACGDREFALAKKAGYRSATTMRIDTLSPQDAERPWALPRLRFMGTIESYGFMECQRSGLVGPLASRMG